MLSNKILVVEDDKFWATALSLEFKMANITFDLAENGQDAKKYIEENNYSLILTDLYP
jgi:DNA-binding response OmpR family regulator